MDPLRFTEFQWQDGYGYTIEPMYIGDWYLVVSYLHDGEIAAYNKVFHKHDVNEPAIKSFPSKVSRKFIATIFGESYISPKAKIVAS
jgi:hypothetical protein